MIISERKTSQTSNDYFKDLDKQDKPNPKAGGKK